MILFSFSGKRLLAHRSKPMWNKNRLDFFAIHVYEIVLRHTSSIVYESAVAIEPQAFQCFWWWWWWWLIEEEGNARSTAVQEVYAVKYAYRDLVLLRFWHPMLSNRYLPLLSPSCAFYSAFAIFLSLFSRRLLLSSIHLVVFPSNENKYQPIWIANCTTSLVMIFLSRRLFIHSFHLPFFLLVVVSLLACINIICIVFRYHLYVPLLVLYLYLFF